MVNEAMNIGKKREVRAGNLMGGNDKSYLPVGDSFYIHSITAFQENC